MLSRLSATCAASVLAPSSWAWLAPALLACRGYATQVGKSLVFGEHGAPERVLRLEQQVLPTELGDHDVLLHLLAVSLSVPAAWRWGGLPAPSLAAGSAEGGGWPPGTCGWRVPQWDPLAPRVRTSFAAAWHQGTAAATPPCPRASLPGPHQPL